MWLPAKIFAHCLQSPTFLPPSPFSKILATLLNSIVMFVTLGIRMRTPSIISYDEYICMIILPVSNLSMISLSTHAPCITIGFSLFFYKNSALHIYTCKDSIGIMCYIYTNNAYLFTKRRERVTELRSDKGGVFQYREWRRSHNDKQVSFTGITLKNSSWCLLCDYIKRKAWATVSELGMVNLPW